MHGSEIKSPFTFRCPEAGLRASIERKGEPNPMKKIFKALAKHFAQYGQYATENLGL
jgi:hypothetical protein